MSISESSLAGYELYRYTPCFILAIIFAVLFVTLTITHTILTLRRSPFPHYWIPFLVGGFFQVSGYAARAVSSHDHEATGPFVAQSLLILLAPALYSASLYMLLGRAAGDGVPFLPRKWLTKIFVGGDVVSFLMQSAGGSLMDIADTRDQVKLGERVMIGGLWAQLGFFTGFMFVGAWWWRLLGQNGPGIEKRDELRILFRTTVIASGLIFVRSAFRVVEFIMGNDGFLLSREVFLYIFDAGLMLGVMGLFAWCFPGRFVTSERERAERGEGGWRHG